MREEGGHGPKSDSSESLLGSDLPDPAHRHTSVSDACLSSVCSSRGGGVRGNLSVSGRESPGRGRRMSFQSPQQGAASGSAQGLILRTLAPGGLRNQRRPRKRGHMEVTASPPGPRDLLGTPVPASDVCPLTAASPWQAPVSSQGDYPQLPPPIITQVFRGYMEMRGATRNGEGALREGRGRAWPLSHTKPQSEQMCQQHVPRRRVVLSLK